MLPTRMSLQNNIGRFKIKEWKKYNTLIVLFFFFKERLAILLSDTIDFRAKIITVQRVHFIMIKGLTHQEDILKVHVPNRDSKYMKQKTLG